MDGQEILLRKTYKANDGLNLSWLDLQLALCRRWPPECATVLDLELVPADTGEDALIFSVFVRIPSGAEEVMEVGRDDPNLDNPNSKIRAKAILNQIARRCWTLADLL